MLTIFLNVSNLNHQVSGISWVYDYLQGSVARRNVQGVEAREATYVAHLTYADWSDRDRPATFHDQATHSGKRCMESSQ